MMGFDPATQARAGRGVERSDEKLPGAMTPDRNREVMTARERMSRPLDPCMPRVGAHSEVIRPKRAS